MNNKIMLQAFSISILFSLLSGTYSLSVSIESDSKWLSTIPSNIANDMLYIQNGLAIYYPQNYSYVFKGVPQYCGSQAWISNQNTVFSLYETDDPPFYALVELNNNITHIINSYPYNFLETQGNVPEDGPLAVGDFIVTLFGYNAVGDGVWVFQIFNAKTNQVACAGGTNHLFGRNYPPEDFWVSDDYLIVGEYANNKYSLKAVNCTDSQVIESDIKVENQFAIDGYIDSSVFIHVFNQPNENLTLQAFQIVDQKFQFGQKLNITLYTRLDDSHFLVVNASSVITTAYYYEITSIMTFNLISSFDVLFDGSEPQVTKGTTQVSFEYKDSSIITYDYLTGAIVQVLSPLPPVSLSNGTNLNMTQFGYFLTSPESSEIQFVFAPNQMNFAYFPEFQQYASLFIPQTGNIISSSCILLVINQTTSSIGQTSFPRCPGVKLTNTIVKDVAYDLSGNINVLYRDTTNQIYIVNAQSVAGPFDTTSLDAFISASMNFGTGVCTFVGTKATSGFILGQFWLKNGSLINSTTISAGKYGYTYKLSSRYFLLSSSNLVNTTFKVWDSVQGNLFGEFNLNFTLGISTVAPFIPLGVDENIPTIYQGLVITPNSKSLIVVNAKGELGYTNNVGLNTTVTAVGPDCFWGTAELASGGVSHMKLYNVTDWDLSEDL